jgi:hypothetical protein
MTEIQPHEPMDDSIKQESTWSSAEKLSRKVRELALRSHRAMKKAPRPAALGQASSDSIVQDLRDLRDQVARLQQKIHDRGLIRLAPWIDALMGLVEDRVATCRD